MSREVALGLLGHEVGIDITKYLTGDDVATVRELMSSGLADGVGKATKRPKQEQAPDYAVLEAELANMRKKLRAVEKLERFNIADDALREACLDLLNGKSRFDRAVNQALIVLEDRVRTMTGLPETMVGKALMNKALGEDGPIILSSIAPEQDGSRLHFMGMYGMLRNPTGHRIIRTYDREDAVAVVLYVDFLLKLLRRSTAGQ